MKRFRRQMVSGVLALSMLATMLPISTFAAEGGESLVEDESLVLAESLQQDSTEEKIQSNGETGTDSPHILSDTEVEYLVEGGNLYFDPNTGIITDCDGAVTSANIPDKIDGVSVTAIGNFAFSSCESLTSVTIPDSVTAIGNFAFSSCKSLTSVTIPDSATSIGHYAFSYCDSLNSVTIGNSVTSIGKEAFSYCDSLTSVDIPDSVTSIGNSAFYYCDSLTSVTIGNSVTSIEGSMFRNCDSLTSVTIGNGVTSIGDNAFYDCGSLTSVDIPDNVTSIGTYAFRSCDSLTSVTIGNGVTSFGADAFFSCDSLTSVTIGGTYIPDGMFAGFNSLTNVTIGDKVSSIGNEAFYNCAGLTSVTIGNGVTSIGDSAFSSCDSLTSVDIPDNVTSIGTYAFRYCAGLTSVTIGNGVTSFGADAFFSCDSLASVTIGGTYIPDGMFAGFNSLTNVTIGDKVSSIGNEAFYNCGSLTNVTVGSGVTSIGDSAFSSCDSLTSVDIPDSVTSIGNKAFSGCTGLTNVIIPDSVTSIGDSAFSSCDSLTSVDIPDSVTSIGNEAFSSCDSLTSVNIPDSVTSIGDKAFSGCTSLTNVIIPDGVTSIRDGVFGYCDSLISVDIPDSVTSIGDSAFSSCDNLIDVYYGGSEEEWAAISIGSSNEGLTGATIHYNNIGPDDPEVGSEISYVAGILKSYDSQTQELFFEYYDGITEVYEYKVTDQTEVENWDTLIGNPVLVSYIPGEYGTGTLSRYVIKVQPAETRVGTIDAVADSTITINGEVFNLNLEDFFGLDYYVGQTAVCYLDDGAVVALNMLEKKTGILNAGSNTSVTIDGVKYAAIFDGIPPYLSAPELWFEQEVEYYYYDNGANKFIFEVSLKPYSSIFTKKLTKWEGTTVTFEDGTIRQTAQDVVFDATLIGKWVDCTIGTTADGGNVITSIVLAKPTYRTEVKKMIAWNDGNPQFSDGTTMGVFLVGDQYDPVMIGRWVELTIEDDLNTGIKITGISLAEPSSKSDFQLVYPTDIYLKGNQYSFDGQNYENSSDFEIEFKISVQNIMENISDINLSEIKKDTHMNLTAEYIQITEPDGFNFGWTGSGAVGDGKELAVPVGEVREVTGFIRPGMLYFVDEKDVTETIACKILLSNGDVFEKKLSFTIHNLDYEEPDKDYTDAELDQIIEEGVKDFKQNNIGSQIYLDINAMRNVFGISGKALDRLEYEILTAVIMSNAPENSEIEEFQDELMSSVFDKYQSNIAVGSYTVPLYYVIKTEKYEELTVRFDCKITSCEVTDSRVAIYATIGYEILGQSSKAMIKVPGYLKTNSALGQIAVTDGKIFCDAVYKVAEDAIKDMYKELWGNTANKAADILFDECIKRILTALDTSVSDITWQIMTWPTKNLTNACPTNVYIYDKNNTLCGSIVNNVITLDSDDFEMFVEDDVKYIKGLTDDYTVKYVATDDGYMDVEITEMMSYDKALRTVKFEDVELINETEFTQDINVSMLAETQSYNLKSTNGAIIPADQDDILITLIPDIPEIIPVAGIILNRQSIEFSQAKETEQLTATISPANATNKTVTWSSSNPSIATVSNSGLVTAVSEGTATITVTTEDGQKVATCTVTVRIESGSDGTGGGGSSGSTTPASYTITTEDAVDGIITISPKTASKGTTVTITATPDDGFTLETLSVFDKNGNKIELTKKTETSYTFKMPASKVTVSATFTEIVVEPEPVVLPFDDILQSAWYYGAVEYVYSNDMMQGTSATTFSPEVEMSRSMIATVLYRLANTPTQTGSISFGDVRENEWYTDAIQWAAENGIMKGYGNNQFGPMDNVTREQLALIFYNYTASKGISVTTTGDLSAFHDAQYTSDWAEEAISWAVGVGLLSGKGNGILDPTGTATRAEVAQILMNYCTKVA